MTTTSAPLFQCQTCGTVDDVEHRGIEANRLSTDDRAAIAERLRETLARMAGASGYYSPGWGDVDTFCRTMAHAIGCSSHDLRVCELDEIRGMASATVGVRFNHTGRPS